MLDHVIVTVSDFTRSIAFYAQALKPLGITDFLDYRGQDGHPDLKGFGNDGRFFFWLKEGRPNHGRQLTFDPRTANKSEDERDDEQDERDPEEHPRAFHRRAGDAAEAKQRRDDGDDEEDKRPVQEISEIHDLNSVVST